jgi:4'-phosphopantetheinyl transferase EntD
VPRGPGPSRNDIECRDSSHAQAAFFQGKLSNRRLETAFSKVPTASQFSAPFASSDALTSLFPSSVIVSERRMPGDPADLLPAEAAHVANAVAKRVMEFAAGRVCAKAALGVLGVENVVLLPGADRQPLWPTGTVGSITHTAGLCAAAVAPTNRIAAIGLDSEIAGAPTVDIWPSICRDEELAWVGSLPENDHAAAVTLLFSAKEAFYKAQYPLVGEWLDFHDLRIEVPRWARARGEFLATPTRDIRFGSHAAFPLVGRYAFHEEFVSAGISVAAV